MVRRLLNSGVVLAALLGLSTTVHATPRQDALQHCEREIRHSYHFTRDQVHDVTVEREGRGSFEVRGRLKVSGRKDPYFTCIVHHREVVSVRVNDTSPTAEAIGKGIIGAVLVGVAAALDKSAGDDDEGRRHPEYGNGERSPLADLPFLEKACQHELRRHLRVGHGRVDRLRLTNVHLHGRTLDGDGVVRWHRGGRQRIHFSCDFDRHGRIHDGRYSYY